MADEPRHGLSDHLETVLPKLQAGWDRGSFSALEEAFIWCAANGYRFPDWLMMAVRNELAYSKLNKPRGGTKTGNSAAQEREERKHRLRYLMMEQELQCQRIEIEQGRRAKLNKEEAARRVQAFLGGKHPAWGQTRDITKSHRRLSAD